MPQYQAVWYGKRRVRSTLLITAATAEEAHTLAAQVDVGQLHFDSVDATYNQIDEVELESLEPAVEATAEAEPVPERDQVIALMEEESWRPSLD